MLLAALLTVFGERRYNIMLLAVILHGVTLLSGMVLYTISHSASNTLVLTFAFILAVYASLRFISLKKIRVSRYTEAVCKEIEEAKEDTIRNAGILFGSMLERDLKAGLRMTLAKQNPDRISEFKYTADHDVSDLLPVVEALLNHAAQTEDFHEGYVLEWEERNTIHALIYPKSE